jgi:8-oxo-dGTP diphosphatase
MITFLVGHGDAGAKGSWDGPDVGRPLSPAGLQQAEGLVLRLEDYPVERILCSPTLRCHQTIQPLARDRLLGIEPLAALSVDGDPSELLELFWDRQLPNAVLCTHGEMISRLFARLTGQGLVAQRRWCGPRARPGCCTAPTGDSSMPATCPHWHSTADCIPADLS